MAQFDVKIADTKKGSRVWLQHTARFGFEGGARYTISYSSDAIAIMLDPEGKRKVTAAKGGIIDLTSQKVTATLGREGVAVVHVGPDCLVIKRRG